MVKFVALLMLVVLVLAPMDVPTQCKDVVFARANPGLCDSFSPFPNFNVPPGSGGGDGGLIGSIGRILHGLTGGLL